MVRFNFMNKRLCGLYVITDENLIPRDSFIETVEKSIKGGADIIQLREKTSSADDIIALGKALHGITNFKFDKLQSMSSGYYNDSVIRFE